MDELYPRLLGELEEIAKGHLRRQHRSHTLEPSALINEAYLRLIGCEISFKDRAHFLATASRAMGQLLVDHARKKRAQKRGGADPMQVPLDSIIEQLEARATDVVALQDALRVLEREDSAAVAAIEMRFFGGLPVSEVAAALELSERLTYAKIVWAKARLSKLLGQAP